MKGAMTRYADSRHPRVIISSILDTPPKTPPANVASGFHHRALMKPGWQFSIAELSMIKASLLTRVFCA